MKQKISVILAIFFSIIMYSSYILAGQSASITVTVVMAAGVDPNISTVEVNPLYIPKRIGLSTITVTPKDALGNLLGSGQAVQIFASAGTLLNGVTDHEDGTYTQILKASKKVKAATITAIVNGETLNQQPKVYFTKGEPAKILMISGDNQTGIIGNPLDEPLVVKIIDDRGKPVQGAPVTFAVSEGGGNVSEDQPVITNKKGLASAILTLWDQACQNTVTASLEGVEGSPITFTAEGTLPLIKAVWLYDLEKMQAKKQKELLSELEKFGISLIYLDIEKDDSLLLDTLEGSELVAEFVDSAGMSGIGVEGMILQEPQWIDLDEQWEEGAYRSNEVTCRVNMVADSGIPFAGLHIDVQPHKHPEWDKSQWEANNELMGRFQNLLALIKSTITQSRVKLPFSTTVAWWYNEAADSGFLAEGDATLLSYSFDYMVPTIFEENSHILYQYRQYWHQFRGMGQMEEKKQSEKAEDPDKPDNDVDVGDSDYNFDDPESPDKYLGQAIYYCVIDEIKELEGTGKGVVIGLIKQEQDSNEKISSLIDWLNKELYPFDSYWATSVYKGSALVPKKDFIIKSTGQVDLSVTTPDGTEIDKSNPQQAEDIVYLESDPGQDPDGPANDEISISSPCQGEYQIRVIPEPGSIDSDTFTLRVIINEQQIIIARDSQIKDIPNKPYTVNYSTDQ